MLAELAPWFWDSRILGVNEFRLLLTRIMLASTRITQNQDKMWWFQWNIKKLRSFIKVSKNERRTYLTNFIVVSISNGYKTKLNSNFVLALSLSYWPINHMSEVNSPTNRNLILTSTDLQLMNSIVPKPYMILMKCWWKWNITSGIRS